MRHLLPFLLLVALPTISSAQTIVVSGEIRERSELDGRGMIAGTHSDAYHLLRSRLAASAAVDSNLTVRLELQDARTFGSNAAAGGGSPTLDLRQGYIDIRDIAGLPLSVRVGRQARSYGNERLIGRVDWSNTGQSFDGVVARIGGATASLDILGAAIVRRSNSPAYNRDHILAGGWGTLGALAPGTSVQGYFLFDTPYRDSVRQYRKTTGFYSRGFAGSFDFEIEGGYQFGEWRRDGETAQRKTIDAWMGGLRGGYTFSDIDSLRIGVGVDRLSGNDPARPATHGAFSALYGTHHRFYGSMDYLVDVPGATRGLGLEQLIVQVSFVPLQGMKLGAELHFFGLATDPRIADPALPAATSKTIGREIDLSAAFQATRALNIAAGFSLFDGDRDRYVLRGLKTTRWGFLMISAGF